MNRLQEQFDHIDRKLVSILERDARKSTAAIARIVGLSRTAVQARIARLEADRIILGYSARLSWRAEGNIGALITLVFNIRPCSLVLDKVLQWPEIRRAYSTAGKSDAILVASVSSTGALAQLVDRLIEMEGVCSVETTMVLAELNGASNHLDIAHSIQTD